MADIAIFEDDAFSVSSLTAAINEQPYQPGRLSRVGARPRWRKPDVRFLMEVIYECA